DEPRSAIDHPARVQLKVPNEMPGVNLLDVAAGKGRLTRSAIFGEIYVHTATKVGAPQLDVTHRWMREGDWKLIVTIKDNELELFNLSQDAHEKNNLAAKQPERVKEMQSAVEKWVARR